MASLEKHVIIVGGGLAGLSAGCYARASGFRTTVVEHGAALGGVCQSWTRGPYTFDGCIHWLTGGPFDRLYRELGIQPRTSTHVLSKWVGYRDVESGFELTFERDLEAFERALLAAAPEDAAEIRRLIDGARRIPEVVPPIEQPAELMTARDGLAQLWGMRGEIGTLVHFRAPVEQWARRNLKNPKLQRAFSRVLPEGTPVLFMLFVLGYLSRGWLSRPDGGSGRFRDALIDAYRASGGDEVLEATVEEILVEGDRVAGVRLADGRMMDADLVIATGSVPETIFQLLGGRYGASELRDRLAEWRLFEPIVLASFGVEAPLEGLVPTTLFDRIAPVDAGGRPDDKLYIRIYNDDPSFAPAGHTVVQAMVPTSYDWWARRRGTSYADAKAAAADTVRAKLEELIPAMRGKVRATDVATPLTFWSMARSWRGAHEGWMPGAQSFAGHVDKKLPGLAGFYMAGQWVEPGGGVPPALMSGRHVVQLLCADAGASFRAP